MNILRLLGDNGADLNIKEATWGYSALIWASKPNNYQAMKYLLEKGANVNEKGNGKHPYDRWNDRYYTPLHFTMMNQDINSMKLVIKFNANINAKTDEGNTVSMMAAEAGNLKII